MFSPSLRMMICIPSGSTNVEIRAVRDSAEHAGGRDVYMIFEPMAAALGAGLDVEAPEGNMVIDIGGGTSEIACISLGGIVCSESINIAGDVFTADIQNYVRQQHNIRIGERTAEAIKCSIGAAVPEVRSQLRVLNGVAKTYAMPGWRVGWMIAPVDVAKAASKLQGHMTSNVNNISQRAAIEAVSGSLDAVYEMRAAFDKRRQTIVAALNDIEGVNCPTPTGAFYAFADVTALLNKPLGTNKTTFANTSELAAALLDEGHVAAVPGEAFGAPGYLRFSYALADDDLVEGMRRMERWVGD